MKALNMTNNKYIGKHKERNEKGLEFNKIVKD